MTRTFALLKVSKETYEEIYDLLAEAAYGFEAFKVHGEDVIIDMHGIALVIDIDKQRAGDDEFCVV